MAIHQFARSEVVTFRVIDSMQGDAARGDWTGTMDGIVRPMLPWTNEVLEDRPETKSRVG